MYHCQNALQFTKSFFFFHTSELRPDFLYHLKEIFAPCLINSTLFHFFLLCSIFSPFNLLICFIFLALYYQMLRDFINIYELFLAFLDEGKYINTIPIYSPAIPNRCKLEQLCLIMGDGICYQIFYKYSMVHFFTLWSKWSRFSLYTRGQSKWHMFALSTSVKIEW